MDRSLSTAAPVQVFCSYSHEDEDLRDKLESHLATLRRQGLILSWHDRKIAPGSHWKNQIDENLEKADLILLLVSADFINSDYCHDVEVKRAMERQRCGEVLVVPVILRPVEWQSLPFGSLQALPRDGLPVTRWPNLDEAFLNVTTGIRKIVATLRTPRRKSRNASPMLEKSRYKRATYSIKIQGTITEFDDQRLESIVGRLKDLSGDVSLTLKRIEPGSVLLIFTGTEEGFSVLSRLMRSDALSRELQETVTAVWRGTAKQSMAATENRSIRVFVSSTFRDMMEEREILIKQIFPQHRKLCENRGVTWTEVDLRWGITQEQAERGEVLPICLAEIERCRPYFIGLLGERYGWVANEIPQELIETHPWLAEHQTHSVTELEILHGVLNNPAIASRAFFYFRDPAYIESLPPERRKDFIEQDTVAKKKLASLKDRIKESGLAFKEGYANPEALGQLVLHDLTTAINQQFPIGEEPDPLERAAADHDAYARSRTGVYIAREEYFEKLDKHAAGEGPPLIVLGESGLGKSSLLSCWAKRFRESKPEDQILLHFIGATADSVNWAMMLRRIMAELKKRFNIAQGIPDKPEEIRSMFANYLHLASVRGRIVLIIDALNQLDDREGALELVWLPPVIPKNIRVVLSTLPGRPLDELLKRNWQTLTVEPLTKTERTQLIQDFLKVYTKELSPEQVERIASSPQAANPLYLQALLEELRVFGIYERLSDRIDYYLEAHTIDDLYQRILKRYEEDYDKERPGLVREAMSLMWAARRGLSEAELLDLLGSDGEPLPPARWSPLFLAAEKSLVNCSGLFGFAHDYLRQAVRARYLSSENVKTNTHIRLADYFRQQGFGLRTIEELPWQLVKAPDHQRLFKLLANLTFFEKLWEADQYSLKRYWSSLEESSMRLLDAYMPAVTAPESVTNLNCLLHIALILIDSGYSSQAMTILNYMEERAKETGDLAMGGVLLGNQANILHLQGDLEGAMRLHKKLEQIALSLGLTDLLHVSLGGQAAIHQLRGELEEALRLHKREEKLCRDLCNETGLQTCLGNQALILTKKGKFKAALGLHKEEELMCKQLGRMDALARSLGNQALIRCTLGDLDKAMNLAKEEERICREIGDKHGLLRSQCNQAGFLFERNDIRGAMKLAKAAEIFSRELGSKEGLQHALGLQGSINAYLGEPDSAMILYKQQEEICRSLSLVDSLQACLCAQADILYSRGDVERAMAIYKNEERILRDIGNKAKLATLLGKLADIHYDQGELDAAMDLYKEQEQVCKSIGNNLILQSALGGQANILSERGEFENATLFWKEQECNCVNSGDLGGLAVALGNQARICKLRGQMDSAIKLRKKEEEIWRKLGNRKGLAITLENQAGISLSMGRYNEALKLDRELEQLSRKLSNPKLLQSSLGGQALALFCRGDIDQAIDLYKQQERICRDLGLKDSLQRCLGGQGQICLTQGDFENAMIFFKEKEKICRELGQKDSLQKSIGDQGNVFYARNDFENAMLLYKQQERICRDLDLKESLQVCIGNQGLILAQWGQFEDAMRLLKEQERICRKLGLMLELERCLSNQSIILKAFRM